LDFTAWDEKLKPAATVVQVFAGLGLTTALLAFARYYFERRCWRRFKRRVDGWIGQLEKSGELHPKQLRDHDWRVECERLLSDAYFGPAQVNDLLETSVVVAKGMAADKGLLDFDQG
jgi:hypothetical protein